MKIKITSSVDPEAVRGIVEEAVKGAIERLALRDLSPREMNLPAAYGGCSCACHRRANVFHCVPCCTPSMRRLPIEGVVMPVLKPSEIRKMIEEIEEAEGDLTDWERGFIDNAGRQFAEDQFLTDGQKETLKNIYDRITR